VEKKGGLKMADEIEIIGFETVCWKCNELIKVYWPSNDSIIDGSNVDLDDHGIGEKVSELIPSIKHVFSYTLSCNVWGNTCSSCGAYQGNHHVLSDYLAILNSGDVDESRILSRTIIEL
jgi:ribosome-interacting GTPase 1